MTDLDTEEIQQPPETLDNDAGEDACPQDMEKVELQEDENLSGKGRMNPFLERKSDIYFNKISDRISVYSIADFFMRNGGKKR